MTLRALTVRGIPEGVLRALRAAAKRNRRSLNAEVLVRLEVAAEETAAQPAAVREPVAQPYEVRRAFEEERSALLESDLRMTPEQRALLSDQLLSDALAVRPRPNVHTVRAFDSWEDYLAWKRTDRLR